MSKRTFYKTTITLDILSEEPIPNPDDITTIANEMINGDYSGIVRDAEMDELDGKEAAEELMCQGSDPGFFGLDDDGEDLLEELIYDDIR